MKAEKGLVLLLILFVMVGVLVSGAGEMYSFNWVCPTDGTGCTATVIDSSGNIVQNDVTQEQLGLSDEEYPKNMLAEDFNNLAALNSGLGTGGEGSEGEGSEGEGSEGEGSEGEGSGEGSSDDSKEDPCEKYKDEPLDGYDDSDKDKEAEQRSKDDNPEKTGDDAEKLDDTNRHVMGNDELNAASGTSRNERKGEDNPEEIACRMQQVMSGKDGKVHEESAANAAKLMAGMDAEKAQKIWDSGILKGEQADKLLSKMAGFEVGDGADPKIKLGGSMEGIWSVDAGKPVFTPKGFANTPLKFDELKELVKNGIDAQKYSYGQTDRNDLEARLLGIEIAGDGKTMTIKYDRGKDGSGNAQRVVTVHANEDKAGEGLGFDIAKSQIINNRVKNAKYNVYGGGELVIKDGSFTPGYGFGAPDGRGAFSSIKVVGVEGAKGEEYGVDFWPTRSLDVPEAKMKEIQDAIQKSADKYTITRAGDDVYMFSGEQIKRVDPQTGQQVVQDIVVARVMRKPGSVKPTEKAGVTEIQGSLYTLTPAGKHFTTYGVKNVIDRNWDGKADLGQNHLAFSVDSALSIRSSSESWTTLGTNLKSASVLEGAQLQVADTLISGKSFPGSSQAVRLVTTTQPVSGDCSSGNCGQPSTQQVQQPVPVEGVYFRQVMNTGGDSMYSIGSINGHLQMQVVKDPNGGESALNILSMEGAQLSLATSGSVQKVTPPNPSQAVTTTQGTSGGDVAVPGTPTQIQPPGGGSPGGNTGSGSTQIQAGSVGYVNPNTNQIDLQTIDGGGNTVPTKMIVGRRNSLSLNPNVPADSEVKSAIARAPAGATIMISATWCGPCEKMKTASGLGEGYNQEKNIYVVTTSAERLGNVKSFPSFYR